MVLLVLCFFVIFFFVMFCFFFFFFFQAEDGIRDVAVTGVQTCALPISFCWAPGFSGGVRTGLLHLQRKQPGVWKFCVPRVLCQMLRLKIRMETSSRDRKSVV